jgi:hypothetical protein
VLNPLSLLHLVRLNRLDLFPLAEIGNPPVGTITADVSHGSVHAGDKVPVLAKRGEAPHAALARVKARYRR